MASNIEKEITQADKNKYPIFSVIEKDMEEYWDILTIDSKISAISDTMDFMYFIMQCEIKYEVVLHDNECDAFSQLRLIDLHDLILLLKGEAECTSPVSAWINKNFNSISKGRQGFYDPYTRDSKLEILINGKNE